MTSHPSNSNLVPPKMVQQRCRRNRTQTNNGGSSDDDVVQHSSNHHFVVVKNALIRGTNGITTEEGTGRRTKRQITTQRRVSFSTCWIAMTIVMFSLQSVAVVVIVVVDGSATPNQPHQSRQFPFWRRRMTTTNEGRGPSWSSSSSKILDTKQASIFRRKNQKQNQNQRHDLDGRTRDPSPPTEKEEVEGDVDIVDLQKSSTPLSSHERDYDSDCPVSVSIAISPVAYIRSVSRRLASRWPRWLRLPPPEIVEELVTVARGIAMGAIVGFIAYQIILVVQDVVREILDENDFMDQDTRLFPTPSFMGSSSQSVVSPKDARKIVNLLDDGGRNQKMTIPNVPSWIIQVAQNLHSYRNLPSRELQRILCEITRTEASLLEECLLRPDSHDDTFEAVGGLFGAKAAIRQWISTFNLPPPSVHSRMDGSRATAPSSMQTNGIAVPHYSQHQSQSPYSKLLLRDSPSGVDKLNGLILWGPPGCGKSLLIRAISNQAGIPTLVITPSLIQRKWFGESTNRVRALFKLVDKLGSVCVVLDEVDGLLRARNENDHEASRELKMEWLQWWDGVASSLLSSSSSSTTPSSTTSRRKCLVVAATNHPWDVDTAAWRRFQHRIYVGLPNIQDRADLLKKWTSDLPPIDPIVLQYVVGATEGYSPSDLFTLLQSAVRNGPVLRGDTGDKLLYGDFQGVLSQFKPTQLAPQYLQKLHSFIGSHGRAAGNGASSSDPDNGNDSTKQWMSSFWGNGDDIPSTADYPAVWNTPWGKYYKISVPVDADVIDALDEMLWAWNDWDEDQPGHGNYLDGDDDDDFDSDDFDSDDFDTDDLDLNDEDL